METELFFYFFCKHFSKFRVIGTKFLEKYYENGLEVDKTELYFFIERGR